MFHGSIVALVTPMNPQGDIDFNALSHLIEWHIERGADAIVTLGATGEPATLTHEERTKIIQHVVDQVAERVPVIAGTGTNCTRTSIELTQHAMKLGVDACMLVTPYYNKPTQEGLYQHYAAVAKNVPIPLLLYNVPSRTACDLLPVTVARLFHFTNIVGVKDATAKIERVRETLDLTDNKIDLLSGDDATAMEFILSGGKGVISVTANLAPAQMHAMCAAALQGNKERAAALNQPLSSLHEKLFVESNPIPVKWALCELKMIPGGLRLPLTPLSTHYHETVMTALKEAKISSLPTMR